MSFNTFKCFFHKSMYNCFSGVSVCELIIIKQCKWFQWHTLDSENDVKHGVKPVQTGGSLRVDTFFGTFNLAVYSNDSTSCSTAFPLWLFDGALGSSVHLQLFCLAIHQCPTYRKTFLNGRQHRTICLHLSSAGGAAWDIDMWCSSSTCKKRREGKRCRLITAHYNRNMCCTMN